jgi:hypothetical protein
LTLKVLVQDDGRCRFHARHARLFRQLRVCWHPQTACQPLSPILKNSSLAQVRPQGAAVHSAGLLFECTGCVCCPALNQSAPQSSKKVTPRGSRKQHRRVTRNVLGRHSGGFRLLRIRRRLPTMAPRDVLHSKAGSQYSGAGEHAVQQALAQTWSLHAVFALRGSGRLRARTPQPPAVTAARAFRVVPISHTVPSAPCRDRTSNVSLRGIKRPTRK